MYVNPFHFGILVGVVGTLAVITVVAYYLGRKH